MQEETKKNLKTLEETFTEKLKKHESQKETEDQEDKIELSVP